VTPFLLNDLAPGRHFLEVSKEGYQSQSVPLDFKAWGSEKLSVELVSLVVQKPAKKEPVVAAVVSEQKPPKKKTGLVVGVAIVAAIVVGIVVYQVVIKKPGDIQGSGSQTGLGEYGRGGVKPAQRPSGTQDERKSSPPPVSSPAVVSIPPSPPAALPVPSVPATPLPAAPPPTTPPTAVPRPAAPPPVAPSASLPQPVAKDPMLEEDLKDAIVSYERGQYDIAIVKLEMILRKDSENQKAKEYIRLAREQKQKAFEQFKKNVEETPYIGGRKK
jgi:hypothetical protein